VAKGRIVVIGASRGGVAATRRLAARLPAEFAAPILLVLHIGDNRSILPDLLSRAGPLPARHATDGERLEHGVILVAPPDHHLLIDDHSARVIKGPKEHHARPAIDPLFLSAALTHGPGAIGVLLTGSNNDGTFGLQAIKRCGGLAVVQHPNSADSPEMPLAALRHVGVDHTVHLEELAGLLQRLVDEPVPAAALRPEDKLAREYAVFRGHGDAMENLEAIGKPSTFVCPDCEGALWEVAGSNPLRYRCHVGHGFSIETLVDSQREATDAALWAAIRGLQERGLMLRKLAELHRPADPARSDQIDMSAEAMARQAEALRGLVEAGAVRA
jgi:two-component system, chemotaxis family, protein-glutamate methylesterase/glutaminase